MTPTSKPAVTPEMPRIDIDDLIRAVEDVLEARQELAQMESEYTGFSPSWALASWIEAKDKAEQKFKDRLKAYIRQEVEDAKRDA